MFNIGLLTIITLVPIYVAIIIKLQLMENKYDATIIYSRFPVAISIHGTNGWHKAVAIKNVDNVISFFSFVNPYVPANPPTNANATSQIVGEKFTAIFPVLA